MKNVISKKFTSCDIFIMNKIKAWIRDYAHLFSYGTIMYFRHSPPKHYLGHVVENKITQSPNLPLIARLSSIWRVIQKLIKRLCQLFPHMIITSGTKREVTWMGQ